MLNTGNRWQHSLLRSGAILAVAALFSSTGFAQGEENKEAERREIQMTVSVPPVPVPTTLAEAVKSIPDTVPFTFMDEQPWFKSSDAYIIPQKIKNKIKVVVDENKGLTNTSDTENGVTLMPNIKVGDGQEIFKVGDSMELNERGEMAEPITFGINDYGEDRPPEGEYQGKMILLFEEVI